MRGSGYYSLVCIIRNVSIYGGNSCNRRTCIDINLDPRNC